MIRGCELGHTSILRVTIASRPRMIRKIEFYLMKREDISSWNWVLCDFSSYRVKPVFLIFTHFIQQSLPEGLFEL